MVLLWEKNLNSDSPNKYPKKEIGETYGLNKREITKSYEQALLKNAAFV